MNALSLRIAIAQINVLVGDIEGNARKLVATYQSVIEGDKPPDLVVFPELCLTGYPPEDLLLRDDLYTRIDSAVAYIKEHIGDCAVLYGLPVKTDAGIFNAAQLVHQHSQLAIACKQCLPNYSVFDEKRYFHAGEKSCVVNFKGIALGITICEDIWQPEPAASARQQGAQLLININASPFHVDRQQQRYAVVRQRIRETGLPVVYANLVGGQDELVFDGASFVMDEQGELLASLPDFEEAIKTVPLQYAQATGHWFIPAASLHSMPDSEEASIYKALVLGVRDYIQKNGFKGAIVGLSGGIDSALTLAIAVDAVGAENVEVVLMPSRFTAPMSIDDAVEEAQLLGVRHHQVSIEPLVEAFTRSLSDLFAGLPENPADTTAENIQARCRGIILMALSNKTGKMLLTTGNKSEMAVGYATLYGDMAGGYAVLKDVSKSRVYALANYRNRIGQVIPQRVIDRPPSAELREDQKDTDSLPDYAILDAILERYAEQDQSPADIIAAGYDENIVNRIVRMIDQNEYKRRQAAPGVRITARAFGRDRRYPITSGYGKSG